jgi:L-asparagine transporter-like permease
MIEFLAGAVTLAHVVAAGFFLRFWRRTADRLFLAFAIAFVLLALNQTLAQMLGAADERVAFVYILRVLAYVLILAAIVDKNLSSARRRRRQGARL